MAHLLRFVLCVVSAVAAPWLVFWRGELVAGILALMALHFTLQWECAAQREEEKE